jgi:wobble nucleotide-excising tRNase
VEEIRGHVYDKSLANKLHLKERLYTIRVSEGTSMQSHLNDSRSKPKGEDLIVRGSEDHKSNIYCRYCRKNTHNISQCPKVRNKEERKKK